MKTKLSALKLGFGALLAACLYAAPAQDVNAQISTRTGTTQYTSAGSLNAAAQFFRQFGNPGAQGGLGFGVGNTNMQYLGFNGTQGQNQFIVGSGYDGSVVGQNYGGMYGGSTFGAGNGAGGMGGGMMAAAQNWMMMQMIGQAAASGNPAQMGMAGMGGMGGMGMMGGGMGMMGGGMGMMGGGMGMMGGGMGMMGGMNMMGGGMGMMGGMNMMGGGMGMMGGMGGRGGMGMGGFGF
jgi:hypothetical protein